MPHSRSEYPPVAVPTEDEMDREFQRCVLTPLVVPDDEIPPVLETRHDE